MFSDDHSGIIWFLMCLIIVTLTGVFLSMLVEKRISFSNSRVGYADGIAAETKILESLRAELASAESQLEESSARQSGHESGLKNHQSTVSGLRAEIGSLTRREADLDNSLSETRTNFTAYRENYRKNQWRDAAGEKIEHLFLKTGRQFDRVIITRVTPFGLSVSHADGNARIDFKDLGQEWQDRFQWDEHRAIQQP